MLVGIVGVGAAVVAPNYLGGKIESVTRAQLAPENLKPFNAEIVKYDRSSRSSDVEIKLGLDAACLGDNAEAAKDIYLVYRSKLDHGPFAGGFNAATYQGELALSPKLQEYYTKLTGQQVLATFSGTFGFNGASNSSLKVPAFEMKDPDNAQTGFRFTGLDVTMSADSSGQNISYNGKSDGLAFTAEDGNGNIGTVEFSGKQNAVVPGVWVGDMSGGIKVISIKEGQPDAVKFEDLSFSNKTTADAAKLISTQTKFVAAKLNIPGVEKNFSNATYDIAAKNLPAEALRNLNGKSTCLQLQNLAAAMNGDSAKRNDMAELSKLFDAMLPDLKVLVAANPTIEINRIGVDTPDGPVNFNAVVNMTDVTDADWQAPLQLLQRLKVAGNLALPIALLPEDAAPMVDVLSSQGYVNVQDKQITSTIKVDGGKALINDKPAEGLVGAFLGGGR